MGNTAEEGDSLNLSQIQINREAVDRDRQMTSFRENRESNHFILHLPISCPCTSCMYERRDKVRPRRIKHRHTTTMMSERQNIKDK